MTTAPRALPLIRKTERGAYPLVIDLPGGVRAELAASDPPRYAVAGVMTAIDVTIPDDLAVAGWYWNGSFLCWREKPDSCGVAIATCTFPPPGHPLDASHMADCMTQAREFERLRAEVHITSMEIRAKVKPTKKRERTDPVQAEMNL